jgi:hypothetical protein
MRRFNGFVFILGVFYSSRGGDDRGSVRFLPPSYSWAETSSADGLMAAPKLFINLGTKAQMISFGA